VNGQFPAALPFNNSGATAGVDNMSKKKKHDDYIERLKRFRWVQWQIVRRHEDYIKFCDKQTFINGGINVGFKNEKTGSSICCRNPR